MYSLVRAPHRNRKYRRSPIPCPDGALVAIPVLSEERDSWLIWETQLPYSDWLDTTKEPKTPYRISLSIQTI